MGSVPAQAKPTDFAGTGLKSVIATEPAWRISDELAAGIIPEYAKQGDDEVAVVVAWHPNVDAQFVSGYLQREGYRYIPGSLSAQLRQVELICPLAKAKRLAEQGWIALVKPVAPEPVELNSTGAMLSRAHVLRMPTVLGGLGLTGKGVKVGVWDGNVEPHIDFGSHLYVREYEKSGSWHGIHVAGTVAGGGYKDVDATGMAPAAELYTWNFGRSSNGKIPAVEMLEEHANSHISITQNSYGLAQTYLCLLWDKISYSFGEANNLDYLSYTYPQMTHVFAVGNEQGACDKAFGTTAARSKSAIYVGAVNMKGEMSDFSSFGPTDDGRIVPTICAKGVGVYSTKDGNGYASDNGTSMACPTVSGHIALLTELYHRSHGGVDPENALVKALVANTANDGGNPGPDYKFGYGVLNAEAAAKVLQNGWYVSHELGTGDEFEQQIQVPAGAKGLRVMIAWSDPAAEKKYAYGEKALINDLDLWVEANGTTTLPWVLDKDNPDRPATQAQDHLNPVEQVTIANPAAGLYKAKVKGKSVMLGGRQKFWMVWYFEPAEMRLVTPAGGEVFEPGERILMVVDNPSKSLYTEISYDDGKSYERKGTAEFNGSNMGVGLAIPAKAPATNTARLRLTDAQGHVLVSERFTILPRPVGVILHEEACSKGSWYLSWQCRHEQASDFGYRVLRFDVDKNEWKTTAEIAAGEELKYAVKPGDLAHDTRNLWAVQVVWKDAKGNEVLGKRSWGELAEYAPGNLAIKEPDLPFYETFDVLPPRFTSVTAGYNMKVSYPPTPSDLMKKPHSHQLFTKIGSVKDIPDYTAPFDEKKNPGKQLVLQSCNLDLMGIPAGTKLELHSYMLLTQSGVDDSLQRTSQLRAVVVDGEGEHVLKNTLGQEVMICDNGLVHEYYWDISAYAEKKIDALRLEWAGLKASAAIQMHYWGIQKANPSYDPAIYRLRKPNDAPHMGEEEISFILWNRGSETIKSLPVVVTLNGAVKGTYTAKDLLPHEERMVKMPIDFSSTNPDGEEFTLRVQLPTEGSGKPADKFREAMVNNLGNLYPMPASWRTYQLFGIEIPAVTVASQEVCGSLKFTDMGGVRRQYTPLQKVMVQFTPHTRGKMLRLTVKDWDLAGLDSLTIYNGHVHKGAFEKAAHMHAVLDNNRPAVVLKDKSTNELVVESHAKDGSLFVFFHARSGLSAEGWQAELAEIEKVNTVALTELALPSVPIQGGEAVVKFKLKNMTDRQLEKVPVLLYANTQPKPLREEVTLAVKEEEQEFSFTQKLAMPLPVRANVEIVADALDGDYSDNAKQATLLNDRYWAGGKVDDTASLHLLQAYMWPTEIRLPYTPYYLQYDLQQKVPLYANASNRLVLKLWNAVDEDLLLAEAHLYVDADDNGDFNGAKEHFSVDLRKGETEYSILVDLTGVTPRNDCRMRLVVMGDDDLVKFQNNEDVAHGYAVDIAADIKAGSNPQGDDMEVGNILALPVSVSLNTDYPVGVQLANRGITDARGKKVTLHVDGVQIAEETVTESIPACGGTLEYTFTAKVRVSTTGKHVVKVSVEPDAAPANDSKTLEIFTEVSEPFAIY